MMRCGLVVSFGTMARKEFKGVATDHRENSQHQEQLARQAEHRRNHVEDRKTV